MAAHLRRQVRPKNVMVVSPGDRFATRFDLIFVTAEYRREQAFASDTVRERNLQWFREAVQVRLSGPDARLVFL
jgi:hypothetical protein